MNRSPLTRLLHPIKCQRWQALKAKRDALPGEPCGQPAHQCSNPRHLEYFYLTIEMERVWNPTYDPYER